MRRWMALAVLGIGMTAQGFQFEQNPERYLLPPLPALPSVSGEVAPGIQGTVPKVTETVPHRKVYANQIDWVMAVDYTTIEVRMRKELSPAELSPEGWRLTQERFVFSDGVMAIGTPQPVSNEARLYRIRVNGLQADHLFTVSYNGSPEMTFRTDRTESETQARYKGRYGDHW